MTVYRQERVDLNILARMHAEDVVYLRESLLLLSIELRALSRRGFFGRLKWLLFGR